MTEDKGSAHVATEHTPVERLAAALPAYVELNCSRSPGTTFTVWPSLFGDLRRVLGPGWSPCPGSQPTHWHPNSATQGPQGVTE